MTTDDERAGQINELARRATAWVETASAVDLWHVIQHGGLDTLVGMPDVLQELGSLSGPGATFFEQLALRSWAPRGVFVAADLASWFAGDLEAQAAVRHELHCEIGEVLFDLGSEEWQVVTFPGAGDGGAGQRA